jgi:hypothetical protein
VQCLEILAGQQENKGGHDDSHGDSSQAAGWAGQPVLKSGALKKYRRIR